MAQVPFKGPDPPHTPEIAKYRHMVRVEPIEERQGPVQKDVVAPAHDKESVIRGKEIGGFGIVDGLVLQPLLHQLTRKEPLAGGLGGGKRLFRNEGVHHLFVDIEKLRDLPGVEKRLVVHVSSSSHPCMLVSD